ncbi:helix-turn-helix domain-containing protein [Cellulomonas bogoriensis]|uniref:Transcriptional regulator n=1 Tax=Cellulomonas bogoriensis 69B4 = DSM 16987 TaxID=1386082 RepID=A0A0A0C1B2_9CELL|nr:helix-turn-helix domain-containing protein [Cellulomonas bogoriensis]KGM14006.1 transcriptional regulator [Cellulomonas bogoriensis 69B4 = DSM 16987]
MSTDAPQQTRSEDVLLTTGEAARLLGASRQHVVNLCDRGELPYVSTGVHRRLRQADVEAFGAQKDRLTRDQRRSLWFAYAIAGKIAADPASTLTVARRDLEAMCREHPRGRAAKRLAEWAQLLDGPVEEFLMTLTSSSPRARELRQTLPFFGVLSDREQHQVASAFGSEPRAPRRWGRR